MAITKSEALFKEAVQYIPGGVNSPVRAFGSIGSTPRFIKKADKALMWDEDDNEYIDFIGSWGPMILGHNHPLVLDAVLEYAKRGLSYGAATSIEVDMAKLVCSMVPSIDMVRMVNSGTEAVMSAVRVARGFTRRDKIIKFNGCYHGHSDALLVKAGSGVMTAGVPDSLGVPAGCTADTVTADYNSLESVQDCFDRYGEQIAAIIVEPVGANMGTVPPKPGFLQGLRDICDKYGSLLIFDEVITGFRMQADGAQGHFGVTPDLTTFGKIIGAGMPVGAYGGRREIMEMVSPVGAVYQAGTLSGNPVAMAAGIAQLTYLKEHPEVDKMIKTDDGHYYVFPFIRGDEKLCNTIGLMLRQDWLEELNLEVPETIDEWHTVLTAFKNEKGVAAPYCPEWTREDFKDNDPFAYAFNTCRSFYLGDDGKVKFGAVEENYKKYLELMNQWYAEGLIDPDMATLKFDQVSAKMTNGSAGVSIGFAGSRMGAWITAAQANDPNYMLVAAPYPTLEKGAKPEFGQMDNQYPGTASVAITTSCKDVERAARLLDYAYGEEGHMLFNFGVEGESYEMKDDYPTYTDWVMKNPDGWPVSQAMSAYIRGNYNGPFVQDMRYLEQYYTIDQQKETPDVWGDTNAKAHKMPPVTPTSEESKEYSIIMNEINTYRDEMVLKFIFGTESLDNFDTYVKNIESMGLDRALEIQNAALERYNAR